MSVSTYTSPGTYTWTCPATGLYRVEVWGGGGGGGSGGSGNVPGSGGGGGAFSRGWIACTNGVGYAVVVGAKGVGGAAWFGNTNNPTYHGTAGGDSKFATTTVVAKGGGGGQNGFPGSAAGVGGAAASGTGDTKYSGGTGATGQEDSSGGGGGSGGTASAGNPGRGAVGGGAAVTGGGPGGEGGAEGDDGHPPASGPGGGGGGGGRYNYLGANAGGNGYDGQVIITSASAPGNPTITAPVGGESWREATSHDVTFTEASPEQAEGFAVAYTLEFSVAGTFADTVVLVSGITATWAWYLATTLVAADTATCKVRIRGYLVAYPSLTSAWSTSGAFTIVNSTAPTVTLVIPTDHELITDLMPTFEVDTADAESDPIHVELQIAPNAAFTAPYFVTDSTTDFGNWNESAPPYTTWTPVPAGGAAAGNRLWYVSQIPLPYGTHHGRVRLMDALSTSAWLTFDFTITLDDTKNLAVAINAVGYEVTGCTVVENTNGEPSPIGVEIDIEQYMANPPAEGDLISVTSAYGGWNRVWNGTVEYCEEDDTGAKVNVYGVQWDAYLSRKAAKGDEAIEDIGKNFQDFVNSWGSPLTGTAIDTATGVNAALIGDYLYLAQHLQEILVALPTYLAWVDPGMDVHFVDTADFGAATYQVFSPDPTGAVIPAGGTVAQFPMLPGFSGRRSILELANCVYVRVKGTNIVGVAINNTVSPTYDESPREMTITIDSGDQAHADGVAAAQLALRQLHRLYLSNVPLDLIDGLAIQRGQNLQVVRPTFGIDLTAAVRRIEHDLVGCTSLVDVGEYYCIRNDEDAVVALTNEVDKLKKRAV